MFKEQCMQELIARNDAGVVTMHASELPVALQYIIDDLLNSLSDPSDQESHGGSQEPCDQKILDPGPSRPRLVTNPWTVYSRPFGLNSYGSNDRLHDAGRRSLQSPSAVSGKSHYTCGPASMAHTVRRMWCHAVSHSRCSARALQAL